jgi:hypothetical protein
MPAAQDIFDRVLLRPLEPDAPGPALLSWQAASLGDRVVQVYVNGELYDVVDDSGETEWWLHLDRASDARIELWAVDPAEAWIARPVETFDVAAAAIRRNPALPIDARIVARVDGRADGGRALWGPRDDRDGFGGHFGEGDFGHDSAALSGFGVGDWGIGSLGLDQPAWRWRRDDLPAGSHVLEFEAIDSSGRFVAGLAEPVPIVIRRLPRPADDPRVDADLTLHWQ